MFSGRRRGAAWIALRSHLPSAACLAFSFGLLLAYPVVALGSQNPPPAARVTLTVVAGSDIRFEHLSTERGLSQSVVDHILQDDQGFMWFGTQDGLDRCDGYEFKIYGHEISNSGLSGATVTALFKDGSGTIWIGEDEFNPVTGKITRLGSDPNNA